MQRISVEEYNRRRSDGSLHLKQLKPVPLPIQSADVSTNNHPNVLHEDEIDDDSDNAGKAEEPAPLEMWKEFIGLVVRSILWEEVDEFEKNPDKSTPEEAQLMKEVREKLIEEGMTENSKWVKMNSDPLKNESSTEINNSHKRKLDEEDDDSDISSGPPLIVKVNIIESSKKSKKDNAEKLTDKGELAAKTSHQEKER